MMLRRLRGNAYRSILLIVCTEFKLVICLLEDAHAHAHGHAHTQANIIHTRLMLICTMLGHMTADSGLDARLMQGASAKRRAETQSGMDLSIAVGLYDAHGIKALNRLVSN